jgi:hypothetical protein
MFFEATDMSSGGFIACIHNMYVNVYQHVGCTHNQMVIAKIRSSAVPKHIINKNCRMSAGAVAAAARELRPVELVGIYEGQKEALEKELAAAKAEVRHSASS